MLRFGNFLAVASIVGIAVSSVFYGFGYFNMTWQLLLILILAFAVLFLLGLMLSWSGAGRRYFGRIFMCIILEAIGLAALFGIIIFLVGSSQMYPIENAITYLIISVIVAVVCRVIIFFTGRTLKDY
jgi:peptidoglycan/LPS O-acetylase OafA/YrhL